MRSSFLRPLEDRLGQAQTDGQLRAGDTRFYARLLHGLIIALTFDGRPDKQRKVTPHEVETAVDVFLKGVTSNE
jgi:hypothetical protein